MSVRVVAHITARSETLAEVRAIVTGYVEPTRKEPGCLRYELLQNNADPCEFTFVEEWSSDEALDVHLQTPHLVNGSARLALLVARPVSVGRYTLLA
jgi:quinol monooxygenase YgiN